MKNRNWGYVMFSDYLLLEFVFREETKNVKPFTLCHIKIVIIQNLKFHTYNFN